jgi:putative peptidoglycan lipid II flippase
MGIAIFALDQLLDPWLSGHIWERYMALTGLVAAGVAVYGVACLLTGAFALDDVRLLINRRAQQL